VIPVGGHVTGAAEDGDVGGVVVCWDAVDVMALSGRCAANRALVGGESPKRSLASHLGRDVIADPRGMIRAPLLALLDVVWCLSITLCGTRTLFGDILAA
jgi:hypothetical protein